MKVEDFVRVIGSEFYTGVPDSQLKALCDYLYDSFGIDGKHHIVAANEGNAVGLAAGYYLATGRTPVVYMQNSGEGNAINPLASLLNKRVYAIPCIFIIGWRGEPGVHDEPQHIFQGKITTDLLDVMGVEWRIIDNNTTEEDVISMINDFGKIIEDGSSVAFVVRKNALIYEKKPDYRNDFTIEREMAIKHIVDAAEDDLIVCTTGKASRELFEIREANGQDHGKDFLTVGSMGHASSIALGIALNTTKRVWCIDGDGAMLMHMGAMATIGRIKPDNLIHIVLNNGAHETVGGMPTGAEKIDYCAVATMLGYGVAYCEFDLKGLKDRLSYIKNTKKTTFIEIKCGLGSRSNLGRPTTTPVDNKHAFMSFVMGNSE